MDNLEMDEEDEEYHNPDHGVYNNDRFFSRRQREFEMLRRHLNLKRNNDTDTKSLLNEAEKTHRTNTSGNHPYANMNSVDLEVQSSNEEMRYHLTPSGADIVKMPDINPHM